MMKHQIFGLILVLAILTEFIETLEPFKFTRPYKYYRPKPRYRRPRYLSHRKPHFYGNLKQNPSYQPHFYHRRQPSQNWEESRYAEDNTGKDPYTIEIEFPKTRESSPWINARNNRNYGLVSAKMPSDEEAYTDEDDDFSERAASSPAKTLRIKVPRSGKQMLKIKVSRNDEENVDNIAQLQNSIIPASTQRRNSSSTFPQ